MEEKGGDRWREGKKRSSEKENKRNRETELKRERAS